MFLRKPARPYTGAEEFQRFGFSNTGKWFTENVFHNFKRPKRGFRIIPATTTGDPP